MDAMTVQIAKLELKAGDTLAVMVPQVLSRERHSQMREYIETSGLLPQGVKVAIFDGGITIAKISPGDDRAH